MKKFEYYTVTSTQLNNNFRNSGYYTQPCSEDFYYDLNQFGENGWELVSFDYSPENGRTYVFKREKE